MEERMVKEFIEHKVLIIDKNHISIDGVKRLKYEEVEHKDFDHLLTEVCVKCYFYNYLCGGIPCNPYTRKDGKEGIWVEDND